MIYTELLIWLDYWCLCKMCIIDGVVWFWTI